MASESPGRWFLEGQSPELALHWESIKLGVQRASQIRVKELSEDHAWTDLVMKPLKGLQVPARNKAVIEHWKRAQILVDLGVRPLEERPREVSYQGIMIQLQTIGIFQELDEERVNIPDVFRVGFGILRKGGVRALK